MLQRIVIDGFRSLSNFELEIRPGLNVLVGPNGAGKTNVIMFFQFLRALMDRTVGDAVGEAGGVAQVFKKVGPNAFAERMSVSLEGTVTVEERPFTYIYSFDLVFDSFDQEVYFDKQSTTIVDLYSDLIHLSAVYEAPAKGQADENVVADFYFSEKVKNPYPLDQFKQFAQRGMYKTTAISEYMLRNDDVFSEVLSDFSQRFVLNVVPSHAKRPEDSTQRPGILSDGSGIASTLYAILRNRVFYDGFSSYRRPKPIRVKWSAMMELVQVAVPSITQISIQNDPFENQLRPKFTIGTGVNQAVVPLSSLSDGTVKWISLVLRLLTSKAALLLEEPENYLHPLMQREIVRLLRDSVENTGFTIISTHSETLLNAVHADELIIVRNEDGMGTKAKRVSNAKQVEEEINNTGFGLGYYYLADAMET